MGAASRSDQNEYDEGSDAQKAEITHSSNELRHLRLSNDAINEITNPSTSSNDNSKDNPLSEKNQASTFENTKSGDTANQVKKEGTPKFYYNGKELTLPGDRELEYRKGSLHKDYEDYKKIVEAERQHELGFAAQTSDSLGEAAATIVQSRKGGTDFTQMDNFLRERLGPVPYTDTAYPENSDASQKNDERILVKENIVSGKDAPEPAMPADTTSFKDYQERTISIHRWGGESLIQLRAYDTDKGKIPEIPDPGTAGRTNLKIETATDGSTKIFIQDIEVPPQYRNSGIASNMLDQTVEIAKAKGASEVYGVIESEDALAYFKHMEEKGSGWRVDSSQGMYGYVRYAIE